ncbi:hypothetical protein ACFOHS_20035 [Jhaorihella thermophila]
MSELQVSKPRFDKLTPPDQSDPAIACVKRGWSEARAKYTLIAPLRPDGQICEGLRYDPELGGGLGLKNTAKLIHPWRDCRSTDQLKVHIC